MRGRYAGVQDEKEWRENGTFKIYKESNENVQVVSTPVVFVTGGSEDVSAECV